MGKIRSAASSIGGFGSRIKEAVLGFESAPLLNAGYLATVCAMAMAIGTFIVSLVLAINNIQIAAQSATGSSGSQQYLSAGTLYISSFSYAIFILLFIAAGALLAMYKVKNPVKQGGRSARSEWKLWGMSVLFMVIVAPLVLLFAENIVVIVGSIIVCVVLYGVISSMGNDSGNSTASAAPAKAKSGSSARIKRIDRSCQVFRADTTWSGKCIITWNGFSDSVVCSQSDYDKGKVRIVVSGTGDKEDHQVLSSPPAKWCKEKGYKG